jgi:hypothetical protein
LTQTLTLAYHQALIDNLLTLGPGLLYFIIHLESSAWGLKESLGVKQWVSIEKQFFQKIETYGKHPKTKLTS